MSNELDVINWNNIKMELKMRYPQLTEADLIWRHGTRDDIVRMVAITLGITRKDLDTIIDNF